MPRRLDAAPWRHGRPYRGRPDHGENWDPEMWEEYEDRYYPASWDEGHSGATP